MSHCNFVASLQRSLGLLGSGTTMPSSPKKRVTGGFLVIVAVSVTRTFLLVIVIMTILSARGNGNHEHQG